MINKITRFFEINGALKLCLAAFIFILTMGFLNRFDYPVLRIVSVLSGGYVGLFILFLFGWTIKGMIK